MIKRWLSFLRPKPKTGKVKLTFRLKPGENVSVNITVKGAAPALSPDVVETPPITGPAGQQEPVSFTVSTQESGSAPVVSISQPAYVPAEVNVQQPETASTLKGASTLKVPNSATISSGNWQSILTRLGTRLRPTHHSHPAWNCARSVPDYPVDRSHQLSDLFL